MARIIITFILLLCCISHAQVTIITPSEVYGEVEKINREIIIIQKHLKMNSYEVKSLDNEQSIYTNLNIQPRQVWQKCYQIMVMINVFRKKNALPRVEEVNIEPVLHLEPKHVYEMTQRILTELRIMKRQMGIAKKIETTPLYQNKKPIDVYYFLQKISYKLDMLNNHQTIPSDVYAQVMRVYEEISLILASLEIPDITTPVKKNKNATPADAFRAVFLFLDEIQLLQKHLIIEQTDFNALKKDNIEPRDVFDMVIISIAEIQPIKASFKLNRIITPPARYFEHKKPADVEQLMLWNIERLKLIGSNVGMKSQ